MRLWNYEELPELPKIKLAVVGHIEWVSFIHVNEIPKAGCISHSEKYLEAPAGGGAVAAVKMAQITGSEVHFFTALGDDEEGQKSFDYLSKLGLKLKVAWRKKPTRKGISFVDNEGERAITVIGERIQPSSKDNLPWEELEGFDGIFITAADASTIRLCRKAKKVIGTPRIGEKALKESNILFDALVGSALDPDEQINIRNFDLIPRIIISTEGKNGGTCQPGGHFKSVQLVKPVVDAYGCGDSFVAALTSGIAANWSIDKAISLGAYYGAQAATYFGPFNYEK
tara:strand:- start:459 stop:1310 length:852 start_codon:yes stop_codon:yes gene_type:complete